MTTNSKKWGWMRKHEESAHGPFESEEEAISGARESLAGEGDVEIMVGVCRFFNPGDYPPWCDLGGLMDACDEKAHDDEFGFWEDSLCDLRTEDAKAAEAELERAWRQWAGKWLTPAQVWWLDSNGWLRLEGC